jgi:threonylcarbamoyladenosine tRNA methylthiotransferase MtaB
MEQVKFAKVHMFPYSPRERTRAALMPNKVAPEVIKERKQRVLRQAERNSFELRELYVGRKMMVLTESSDSLNQNEISGHTDNFLNVIVNGENLKPNQLIEVELVANTPQGLIGKLVS